MNGFLTRASSLVFVLALLSACGKGDTTNDDSKNAQAVLISTDAAELTDLEIWLTSVGIIHATRQPTLAAEVEGRITLVSVDTGDSIERGQLLAETDTSALLLEKQAAQASLERFSVHIANGKRRVERYQKLSSQNLSSQTQLDDAREQLEAFQADHKAAKAKLAIVDDSLSKSRITAPVAGTVQNRFISAGDYVKRGDALFEVTQPSLLQAWLPYAETLAAKIKVGQQVIIKSPVAKGQSFRSTISELQPALGSGSRALSAIIEFENPGYFKPEVTISGKVLVDIHEQAVMVPDISVVRRPAGETVYVIESGQARAQLVTTGHYDQGRVEIVKGLNGSETLATDGAAFLTDGALVKTAEQAN